MTQTIKGNIFDVAKTGYIMHQVNCQNVMGAGIAADFAKRFPQIKSEYHDFCNKTHINARLGAFQQVTLNDSLIGINSYSQFTYGNAKKTKKVYTDSHMLIRNLIKLDQLAKQTNTKAYIPKYIGCGLAGADWTEIEKAIEATDLIIVEFK